MTLDFWLSFYHTTTVQAENPSWFPKNVLFWSLKCDSDIVQRFYLKKMAFQVPHSTSLGVRKFWRSRKEKNKWGNWSLLLVIALITWIHQTAKCAVWPIFLLKKTSTYRVCQPVFGEQKYSMLPKNKCEQFGKFSPSYSTQHGFHHLTPIQRKKKHHALRSSSSIQRSDRLWSKVVSFAWFGKHMEQ